MTRNRAVAAKPCLKAPSSGASAQPAACPSGSLLAPAFLPEEGNGCQVRTKTMPLFPITFQGTEPWKGGRLGQELKLSHFVLDLLHEEEAGPDCLLSAVTDCARSPPLLFPHHLLDSLQA